MPCTPGVGAKVGGNVWTTLTAVGRDVVTIPPPPPGVGCGLPKSTKAGVGASVVAMLNGEPPKAVSKNVSSSKRSSSSDLA